MRIFFRWFKRIIIAFFILSILSVIFFRFVPVPITPFMIKRYFINKSEGKKAQIDKDWVSLEEISKNVPLAVVSSEDQNFLTHHGFDFNQIQKAIEKQQDGGKLRGASTISQQTAKNVFLWDGGSFVRKGLEAYFTGLIELVWGKKRIMEMYLNVIEFGDGIYGVEAASHHYFGKSAENLTKSEAASLAAILPNPRVYGEKINGRYMKKRQAWILRQMRHLGGVNFK